MLKNFLGLFLLTLLICIFILLMQFLWLHVKDLVGKGVELSVLAEFFMYAVASVVPLALPLAVLLASLMVFGNLGEKFELIAMKAAGISLFRIMRPLIVGVLLISMGAFFFSNNVLPKSQTKLWVLIFSLRQKSPEFDIPVGEFYDGISGYNIYVRHKDNHGLLKDLMIYDFSKGFQNATVMLADSGRVYFTQDNKYLVLKLYSGESFENLKQGNTYEYVSQDQIPYRREMFSEKQLLIDFDTEFNRFDESVLADQHVSKNVVELQHSIDSVHVLVETRSAEQSQDMVANSYFGREYYSGRVLVHRDEAQKSVQSLAALYESLTLAQREEALQIACEKAGNQQDRIDYNAILLDDSQSYIRKHLIELHRKFTLSFACLIFFFIGAPLGAIIRKGGLGMPVVISVVMFIIYYIIDNTGYKMAREALWPVWVGMWLSSAVLSPVGIFFTYKAATDSAIFRSEGWLKGWIKVRYYMLRLVGLRKLWDKRHHQRKSRSKHSCKSKPTEKER